MILKLVHNSRISAFAIAFLLLPALWVRLFFFETVHITTFNNPCMPLWGNFIEPIFGYSKFSAAALSLILAFFIAFSLNRIVLKFSLMHKQSMLPFVIYAFLSCAFLSVQKLNPVWIFTLFFILGIEQLFLGVNKRKPQVNCFNSALLAGVGSLFYAKGILLFSVFFVIMAILRLANHKTIIASLLGLMFPFVFQLCIYFFSDSSEIFFDNLQENILTNQGQYNHILFSKIYLGTMIFLNVISIIMSFKYMQSQKNLTRRYFRCFMWMMFISCAAILTPFFSMEIIPIIALISTVIISLWLDNIKQKRVQEVVMTILIVMTVLGMFILN